MILIAKAKLLSKKHKHQHLSEPINTFQVNMKSQNGKLFDFELGHKNLTMDGKHLTKTELSIQV